MIIKKIFKLVVIFSFILIITACDYQPSTYYNVTFLDEDGTVLATSRVMSGKAAKAPTVLEKEGYEFVGWDKEFTNVTENLEVKAIYKRVYEVIFRDIDGNIVKNEKVLEGNRATAPELPEVPGYIFIEWDRYFYNVKSDLDIRPRYIRVYRVTFYNEDGTVIKSDQLIEGEKVTPPANPRKDGCKFVGWSEDFSTLNRDLEIYPVFELIDPLKRVQYSSYVSSFDYYEMAPVTNLLSRLDYQNSLVKVIPTIYHGKIRNTNQLHYYDHSNLISRNNYGFEVAVNAYGIVIDMGTIVDLPAGGFILSGHGTSSTYLQDEIEIGDIIVYNYVAGAATNTAYVYRDYEISNVIALGVEISKTIVKVDEAFHEDMYACDYQTIVEKINNAILTYKELIEKYEYRKFADGRGFLLDVDFLLIEGVPVQVRSFWHYPTYSSAYPERNVNDIQRLLDMVAESGFNRIYLNTNFGGYAVYQSDYLMLRKTNGYTYGNYKDYLECFVTEAHLRGIEVYAWTNTLICGDGSVNSWYRDRGWLQIGYNGEDNFGGMYFLDISNPDVQTFLRNVFNELASNYELDGIEYDFIRYPSGNLYSFDGVITNPSSVNDSGYTQSFINLFKERVGFTGDIKSYINSSKANRTSWLNFKRSLLNEVVEMISTTIKTARPGIKVSAAVMPSISSARSVYQQDWEYWIDRGWVDILEPMLYSGNTTYVINSLIDMYNLVNGRADIVVGIFPEENDAMLGLNAEQIARIGDTLPVGWAKFSSKKILTDMYFLHSFSLMNREYVALPSADINTIYYAYIYDLLDKVENFYQYIDLNTDYTTLCNILEEAFLTSKTASKTEMKATLTLIENQLKTIGLTKIKDRLLKAFDYIEGLIG